MRSRIAFVSHTVEIGLLNVALEKERWLKERLAYHGLTEQEAKKYCVVQERLVRTNEKLICTLTITWTRWLRIKLWFRALKR